MLTFHNNGDHLIAIVSGVVNSFEDLSAMAHGVVEMTSEHWSKKALVDFRTVSMNIDFLSAQTLANDLEDEGVQLFGIRLACLYTHENIDIYRVFETAHQNRSLNFKIFEHEDEAVDWLMS
ncbi:hypothetical protein [Pseudodesulfovibrio nedwellii]|nr:MULTISPECIES: hypothetical protein [Pseudodesulfovibrio]